MLMAGHPQARWLRGMARVACLAGALLCGGCGGRRAERPAAGATRAPVTLSVFYTCDTQGHLHPCDCDTGKEGGIGRRAQYLALNPARNRLLVDAGNVTAGRREWETLEWDYLLKGYRTMGYDALNLGHREAGFSAEALRAYAKQYEFLVSANLLGADGLPVVAPYLLVKTVDGLRVGITGIMDDSLSAEQLGEGLSIAPPDAVLGGILPELAKRSHLVVLLAFADESAMTDLANLFFEIGLVVGGKVRQPFPEPVRANEALLVCITDKGKSIGRIDVRTGAAGREVASSAITVLTEAFGDAPEVRALLAEYDRELTNRNFRARQALRDDAEGLSAIRGTGRKGEDDQ